MENNSRSQTSLDSSISFPPSAFNVWLTILTGLGLVVVLLVVSVVPIVWFLVTHGFDTHLLGRAALGPFGLGVQSMAEVVPALFLIAVLPALAKTTLRGLGFRALRQNEIAPVLYGIAAMILLVNPLASLLSTLFHVKPQEAAVQMFLNLNTPVLKAAFALLGIVLAPFFEELTFRVFLFNAMRVWWRFWPAAIVSSLIFGSVHIQGGGLAGIIVLVVPLALAGFILCTVYAKTGNAWASMITHGAFNASSLIMLYTFPQLVR